jgi:hypothetical protein
MARGTEVNDGTSTSQVNSYEYMTARETLRFTARFFYEGPRVEIERRVAETLDLVGLADKADHPIKGFSGGERQRLGIAQAQVNYPDPETRARLEDGPGQYAGQGDCCLVADATLVDPVPALADPVERHSGFEYER